MALLLNKIRERYLEGRELGKSDFVGKVKPETKLSVENSDIVKNKAISRGARASVVEKTITDDAGRTSKVEAAHIEYGRKASDVDIYHSFLDVERPDITAKDEYKDVFVEINSRVHIKKPVKGMFMEETFKEIEAIRVYATENAAFTYVHDDGSEERVIDEKRFKKFYKKGLAGSRYKKQIKLLGKIATTMGMSFGQFEKMYLSDGGPENVKKMLNKILGNGKAYDKIMEGLDYVETSRQYKTALEGLTLTNGRLFKGLNGKTKKASRQISRKTRHLFNIGARKSEQAKNFISEDGELIRIPLGTRIANAFKRIFGRSSKPDFGKDNLTYSPEIDGKIGKKTGRYVTKTSDRLVVQSLKDTRKKKEEDGKGMYR